MNGFHLGEGKVPIEEAVLPSPALESRSIRGAGAGAIGSAVAVPNGAEVYIHNAYVIYCMFNCESS